MRMTTALLTRRAGIYESDRVHDSIWWTVMTTTMTRMMNTRCEYNGYDNKGLDE